MDDMYEKYKDVNPNDSNQIKLIIASILKPYFEHRPEKYKIAAKLALAYYLTTKKTDFGSIYDSCLVVFEHPDNPRDFFVWIWEVFFPKENFNIIEVNEYKEIDDIKEPLLLASKN